MEQIQQPTILIIVGVSGDLSQRYLLPAIRTIASSGVLPEQFQIVGITRQPDLQIDTVLPEGDNDYLRKHFELWQMNLAETNDYIALGKHLEEIEEQFGAPAQRIYYLSVPPQASQPVINHLGTSGLTAVPHTKLLLEKPFGIDRSSAEELIEHLMQHAQEEQIYRIDHYMAKEMAQNILSLRTNNPLFRCTWNKDFIEYIEIHALESIDIEGRAGFYEQTGALRDFVQSHLLQLAALTLMDVSEVETPIPTRRARALAHLLPPEDVTASAIRGQYRGYREHVENPDSSIETFVSLSLQSSDMDWRGVPITLITGKALHERKTEIRVHYRRQVEHELGNTLTIRVQPNEGITLSLWVKQPGYSNTVQEVPLSINYDQHFDNLPNAYERVFVDAMRGDRSLFTTSQEVLESWRILDPVQHHWGMQKDGLVFYEPGSTPDDITAGVNAQQ